MADRIAIWDMQVRKTVRHHHHRPGLIQWHFSFPLCGQIRGDNTAKIYKEQVYIMYFHFLFDISCYLCWFGRKVMLKLALFFSNPVLIQWQFSFPICDQTRGDNTAKIHTEQVYIIYFHFLFDFSCYLCWFGRKIMLKLALFFSNLGIPTPSPGVDVA